MSEMWEMDRHDPYVWVPELFFPNDQWELYLSPHPLIEEVDRELLVRIRLLQGLQTHINKNFNQSQKNPLVAKELVKAERDYDSHLPTSYS